MPSYNKVMLIGNLTRDPEVRYTPKGSAVCDIGLAVNRVWNDEQGQKQEEVTFVDIVLWSKLAELAGKYLHKGRPVFIEGRLQMDSWEDKQTGQKRTRLRVVGEQMQFLGAPEGQEGRQESGEGRQRPAAPTGSQRPPQRQRIQQGGQTRQAAHDEPMADGMEEDDIPF